VEHFAGKFPLWLAPEQIRILTITDKNNKYAEELEKNMINAGMRVCVDYSTETINKKVRNAQLLKVPLIVTVGDKEQNTGTLAIRTLDGEIKFGMKVNEFIKSVKENISERKLIIDFL
jgi:threonyl-tRNA synthetase